MHDDEIWEHVDAQRAELADLLETLVSAQWATPSLCDAWTVREVAVHLVQANAGWGRMALEALRSGFRFDAMMARVAREDRRSTDEIVAALRGMVGSRRRPPGTKVVDPLLDALVHGQDIARPLGLPRTMPQDAALVVAERLWTMTFPINARRRFPDVRFEATDAPFAVGGGRVVARPLADVVMLLAGRNISPSEHV